MQRITGLPDEQVLIYEARAEAALRAALASVMDKIAKRIEASAPTVASSNVDIDRRRPDEARLLVANGSALWSEIGMSSSRTSVLVAADGVEDQGDEVLPSSVPEGDGLPPGQPYVSPDDLTSIPPLWQQAVADQILPIVGQVFLDAALRTHANMIDASSIAGLPSAGSLAAEQYLARARNSFEQIGDTLWAQARSELTAGFEAGESIPQLAERLRQSANVTARTGVLVARTQVNEASNAGSFETARASGLQMQKEWIATPDLRTRPTHLAADGQRVDLNEPFIVGGFSAMFPAAPTLPPAERYSCRCTIGYVMPDRAPAQVRADDLATQQLEELPGTTSPIDDLAATQSARLQAIIDEQHAQVEGVIEDVHRRFDERFGREAGPGIDLPARGENPPGYIRPSLQAAKTPRQLRRVWQDEVESITGFPFVVDAMPRGISMVTAREYAEGTLQMFAQFPGARVDRIHWFDDPASSSYAQVRRGGHAIEFNMRYASEAGRPKFLAARRRDVAGWDDPALSTSWGVRNDLGGQGVVYHEFTHILDIENGREVVHGQIVPLLIRHAQTEGITDIDDLIKRRISSYATKNYQEMVAEAGTDVMVNGAAASQLSRDIFDLVRAEYRRRGFEIRTAPALPEDLAGEAFPTDPAPAPGWIPGAWSQTPLDRARQEIADHEYAVYRANQERFGFEVDEAYGRQLGRGIAEQELPDSATAYQNGEYLIVDPGGVSAEVRTAVERQFDALTEIEPLRGPFTVRLRSQTGDSHSGPSDISLTSKLNMEPTAQGGARHFMPSAKEQPKAVYTLTHEYGHSVMFQRGDGPTAMRLYDELKLGPDADVVPSRTLGYYGMEDYKEAYAEAFAEWNLSAGLTENAQVLRYAREFGWRDPLAGAGDVFPKAAAPRALSTQTVAQLRALAKERGIAIPAGARKADLVKALSDETPGADGPGLSAAELDARLAKAKKGRPAASSPSVKFKVDANGADRVTGLDSLSLVERERIAVALDDYRGFEFSVINDLLRGVDSRTLQTKYGVGAVSSARGNVTFLDRAFEESRLADDVVLWRAPGSGRGIFGDPGTWGDDLTGFSWRDDAYSSTSASRATADRFLKDGGVRLRLLAPKDGRAIRLSESGAEDEMEVLLDRGAEFRVVRDRGWTEMVHPETKAKIRIRDLDVEVVPRGIAPPVAAPIDEKALLRAAARERNRLVESSQGTARLLAEVDELIANKATKAAIRQRLDPALIAPEQVFAGADPAVVEALRKALDTGDPAKLRAALTRAGTKSKLKPISKAGAKTKFDPETMEGVGGIDIPAGAQITVVRRGTTLKLPDGSTMQLTRAQVTPIAPKPAPVKAAKRAPRKVAPKPEPAAPVGRVAPGPAYETRMRDIRRLEKAPETKPPRQLGGGSTSDVTLLTRADGQVVEKVYGRRVPGTKAAVAKEVDAEELAPLVVQEFGVRAAATAKTGADRVIMEFVDGETIAEKFPGFGYGSADEIERIARTYTETNEGRLLGLADYVIGNTDRNEGNWIRREIDGRLEIVAIDHGYAFVGLRGTDVPAGFFTEFLQARGPDGFALRAQIDVNPADLRVIRQRLEGLRQRFIEAGRKPWHDAMMRRLRALEQRADPSAPIRLATT